MTVPAPIEQIARDTATEMADFIRSHDVSRDELIDLLQTENEKLLRQACGQQPAVAENNKKLDRILAKVRAVKWHVEHCSPREYICKALSEIMEISNPDTAPHPVRGGEQ